MDLSFFASSENCEIQKIHNILFTFFKTELILEIRMVLTSAFGSNRKLRSSVNSMSNNQPKNKNIHAVI